MQDPVDAKNPEDKIIEERILTPIGGARKRATSDVGRGSPGHNIRAILATMTRLLDPEPAFTADETSLLRLSKISKKQLEELSKEELGILYDNESRQRADLFGAVQDALQFYGSIPSSHGTSSPKEKGARETASLEHVCHLPVLPFFSQKTPILLPPQLMQLRDLNKREDLRGIFLLVEDTPSQLKILFNSICLAIKPLLAPGANVTFSMKRASYTCDSWQRHKMTLDIIEHYAFLCAANGEVALEIIKKIPSIKAMITDKEMPLKNGIDLIRETRELEQIQNRSPMTITLNTAIDDREELEGIILPLLATFNAHYLSKGGASKLPHVYRQALSLPDPETSAAVMSEAVLIQVKR